MTDLLAYRRGIWLRRYNDTEEARDAHAAGTDPTAAIVATLTSIAHCDLLMLECAYGLTYEGLIDPLTPIRSVTDVADLAAQLAAAGIQLVPVVVPLGQPGEAEMHGAIMTAAGCGVVDIEYDPSSQDFWYAAPLDDIPIYFRALRTAAGPNVQIIGQPDPRNTADVRLLSGGPDGRGWAQYVSGLSCQHYVGWTAIGWSDVAAEVASFTALAAASGLPTYPALWGTGDLELTQRFWDAAREAGALGCTAFALGPMNSAQLGSYAWFALPAPAVPKPPPTPGDADDLAVMRAAATGDFAAVAGLITPFVEGK